MSAEIHTVAPITPRQKWSPWSTSAGTLYNRSKWGPHDPIAMCSICCLRAGGFLAHLQIPTNRILAMVFLTRLSSGSLIRLMLVIFHVKQRRQTPGGNHRWAWHLSTLTLDATELSFRGREMPPTEPPESRTQVWNPNFKCYSTG